MNGARGTKERVRKTTRPEEKEGRKKESKVNRQPFWSSNLSEKKSFLPLISTSGFSSLSLQGLSTVTKLFFLLS